VLVDAQRAAVSRVSVAVAKSAYDALAPRFDRDRHLPAGVAEAVRAAMLDVVAVARPKVLDLGAGTGRIGWPFVAAGDDYVGADLSFGMLQAFVQRCDRRPRLVQADGHRLPFGDASFDAVLLIQVFGGIGDWQQFAAEVRRVLRPSGAVSIGRTVVPDDGVDARMKRQLDLILGTQRPATKRRADIQQQLGADAAETQRRVVGTWSTERTPRQFIARHRGGARFSALPDSVKDVAMVRLAAWAEQAFGSLDAALAESHAFELQLFKFEGAVA
jgi:ubiquinone/menaquinone biosynthesis C-methylase UbiE